LPHEIELTRLQALVLGRRIVDQRDLDVQPLGFRRRAWARRQAAVTEHERHVTGPGRDGHT
jgi:hypothetical protein